SNVFSYNSRCNLFACVRSITLAAPNKAYNGRAHASNVQIARESYYMQVPLWVWLATIAGVIALLALSFFTHIRKAHEPSIKEAGAWTAFFVTLAVLFGLGLTRVWGWDHGIQFFAGYITEYSLSIDNLFVFVIIMASFAVPKAYQQKVLLIGIVIALVLRTIFILIGAAAIAHFSWVFYLFGLFLIFTA